MCSCHRNDVVDKQRARYYLFYSSLSSCIIIIIIFSHLSNQRRRQLVNALNLFTPRFKFPHAKCSTEYKHICIRACYICYP